MLGKVCDINLATAATLTAVGCSTDLPVTNLQEEGRYILAPARFEHLADPVLRQIDIVLETPSPVSLLALFFTTFSLGARYRVTIAEPGGTIAAPAYDSGWLQVFPSVYETDDLPWEHPGCWMGQLSTDEIDLYPRHLWTPVPTTVASQIRYRFDDALNEAGFFDIGGLFVADAFSPVINFERGRDLAMASRDLVDEAPSGRNFVESRQPRRQLSVNWAALATAEAYRLFDAGARARTSGVVVFVPDTDDPASLMREAFPATFEKPPAPRFTYERLNAVAATFKEILG